MKEDNEDKDNIPFNEFQDSLNNMDGNLHVLDTYLSIEEQMAYFKYSEEVRKTIENTTIKEQIEILHNENSIPEEIKYAITYLAISGEVKAYRELENYTGKENESISDWLKLALLQAKITLESEFLEEKQIFISTGLGGRGSMLRFFAFVKSTNLIVFSDYQRNLIEKEIPFSIQRHKGTLEDITIADNYFTIVFLIDIRKNIRNVLKEAIDECNQYGHFINSGFIVSNVKIYTQEEIERELRVEN